jgi:pre-mRNA-splicing helicase BRR2
MITFIGSEASEADRSRFINVKDEAKFASEVRKNIRGDQTLKSTLEYGVGILHDGISDEEKAYVIRLYQSRQIMLLVAIHSLAWSLDSIECHLVVILDAERFDGQEKRSVEYSIPDVLQMMGRANYR